MTDDSLQDLIDTVDSPVELLRDWGWGRFTELPSEFTHWIEEQKAWRESCALMDLSYHMSDLTVEGRDALQLYSDLAINDFSTFPVGQAKQLVVCNPDGYLIGDAILFHLSEETYLSVGPTAPHNWIVYHAETGEYDVDIDLLDRPVTLDRSPNYFRYQVQGPDAYEVMDLVTDSDIPDIPFFHFGEISINGHPVNALRHGMAGESGFELFGPYENGEEIKRTILDAGEAFGIRRVGTKAYKSVTIDTAWVPLPVPAIYDGEAMQEYREWLDARRGLLSIGGSFDSDDISDYYIRPTEVGYERFIDFDRDFIGKDALQSSAEDPERTKVSLLWDNQDAIDVYGSLFGEGDTFKFMDMPCARWSACHYDEVRRGDDQIGVSVWTSYSYNERRMISLALVEPMYSDPGTELELVWGEPDWSKNPEVEQHAMTKVNVSVAPAPYKQDRR